MRRRRLNSGYSGNTDQRRTGAGTISMSKHYMERSLGDFNFVAGGWTPTLITTALWLDANDAATITLNNNNVSQWNDKSGNGRHATQSTSSSQPLYSGGEIAFDGSNDFLIFSGSNATSYPLKFATSTFDVFAVISPNVVNALQVFFGARGFNDGWFAGIDSSARPWFRLYSGGEIWNPAPMTSLTATTGLQIWQSSAPRGSTGRYRKNGSLLQSTASAVGSQSLSNGRFCRVGAYSDESDAPLAFWRGKINELILLAEEASQTNREKLEGYLAYKWGLQASLPNDHPYKNAAPAA